MCEQIAMFKMPKAKSTDLNAKRRWENAFQKWSDEHGLQENCTKSWGACGYGSMCEWCKANDYGRPCVRALNAMCREKNIKIDYTDRNFEKVWDMKGGTE